MNSNNVQYNSEMFPHSLPFDPVIPAEWLSIDNPQWMPVLNPAQGTWDGTQSTHQSTYSGSPNSSYDPLHLMPGLPCDTSPEYEPYSPPSTTTSEVELPPAFDHFTPTVASSAKPLPMAPIVPSSSRETPPAPTRRMRRPSKDLPKPKKPPDKVDSVAGVHPYACIGCGETFRRTDARTRHWCKQPDCFKIHSAKAPASKVRRRIP
ncbi:hypothetical protein CTheo_8254 [Ceratobasidium theobromae]|uniref:C2H2-type domain-containing protein n=1 Tax=Ceratobasidium theobromae TaxID=1582974 RepID=A0A5N5Q9G7_9AGAM|nr:hypothetical protein CTheo_8254 [Ceratobasidium theobromae]